MSAATLVPEPVQQRSPRHVLQVESSNLLCSGSRHCSPHLQAWWRRV